MLNHDKTLRISAKTKKKWYAKNKYSEVPTNSVSRKDSLYLIEYAGQENVAIAFFNYEEHK